MQTQDMEHVLNILARAERAARIGIVLGPESGDAELLAAHALKERLGEKAAILNAPDHLQDRWASLFKKEHPRMENALTLDTEAFPVHELRYEKDGEKLRILLSSAGTTEPRLTKDAFEIEKRHVPSDMIIAMGFAEENRLENLLATSIPLTDKEALINLPTTARSSPSQHQTIEEDRANTALWDINTTKLWGRAMLRSSAEKDEGMFWAFLPKEDFQKTGVPDTILPSLVAGMRRIMDMPPLCIVLWQDQTNAADNVHALISGTDEHTISRLSAAADTPLDNNTMLSIQSFPNFSEAEVEIRKLLTHNI